MKILKSAKLVAVAWLALLQTVSGQGFVNLDFEGASIVPNPSSPYYPNAVYSSSAIPGWTPMSFLGSSEVLHNGASIGAPSVSIHGTNGGPSALDGKFSIYLYGGHVIPVVASISQIGLLPVGTKSILFRAKHYGLSPEDGSLVVSLGGQIIAFSAFSTGPTYSLYGGNISSDLTGQNVELRFSAPAGEHFWNIDDIEFSGFSVPEPSVLCMFTMGGGYYVNESPDSRRSSIPLLNVAFPTARPTLAFPPKPV